MYIRDFELGLLSNVGTVQIMRTVRGGLHAFWPEMDMSLWVLGVEGYNGYKMFAKSHVLRA